MADITEQNITGSQFVDALYSVTTYEKGGIIAKALHLWKYEGQREYANPLFELFRRQLERILELNSDWLIKMIDKTMIFSYIPLHSEKLRLREFNQAEELTKSILKTWDGFPIIDCLVRTMPGKVQMTLSAEDRIKNVAGIYQVRPKLGSIPREIILVDDVSTTMATLNEAAKALKEAGVTKVYGFVLARHQ